MDLGGVDIGGEVEEVPPGAKRHHDLLQGGVSCPLSNAIDGALHLSGAAAEGSQAVGHGKPQVVMAVNADCRLVYVGHVLEDAPHQPRELLGRGVAHGIGDVDRCRPGIDGRLKYLVDEVGVSAGGIHGRELHILNIALGASDHGGGKLKYLLPPHPQLVGEVNVGAGEEDVNSPPLCLLYRLPGAVHSLGIGMGQGADYGLPYLLGDEAH